MNDLKSLVTIAAGLFSTLYLAVAPPARTAPVTLNAATVSTAPLAPGQFEVVDYSATVSTQAPAVPSKDDVIAALRADIKLLETELGHLRAENAVLKGEVERLKQPVQASPSQAPAANPTPIQKRVSEEAIRNDQYFTGHGRLAARFGACGAGGCGLGSRNNSGYTSYQSNGYRAYGGGGRQRGPIRKAARGLKALLCH